MFVYIVSCRFSGTPCLSFKLGFMLIARSKKSYDWISFLFSLLCNYPIHLFGEISRRGEISLKMTNIALVRALRIWVAQRMYWHILPKQGWSYILVKMSIFWKFFFAFSNVKSLSEYVVKILALKFEPKKSYGKKSKFSICKNALIGPVLE